MPEEQRVAVFELRLDLVLEDVGLRSVGRQKHDHVGPLGDLGGGVDVEALLGDLVPRLRTLAQSDLHLDTGVAQAQRVRVPLAAVPDDADLATLDDRQVRVVVVEHLNCHSQFLFCLGYLPPVILRGPRAIDTMPDWTISRTPYGSRTRSSASNFAGVPVHLDRQATRARRR